MPIWSYDAERLKNFGRPDLESFYTENRRTDVCMFCASGIETLRHKVTDHSSVSRPYTHVFDSRRVKTSRQKVSVPEASWTRSLVEEAVRACPACGWWLAFREILLRYEENLKVETFGGLGALKILDLSDISTPIEEVRSYLAARYDQRFTVNPKPFEETVASVFRDLGYTARVTAYSGDDGIDVILDGPARTIGVHVKRYQDRISVAQIREGVFCSTGIVLRSKTEKMKPYVFAMLTCALLSIFGGSLLKWIQTKIGLQLQNPPIL